MTERRNTPRFDEDDPDEPRPASSRRFARLAAHPAARRLALSKLAWAAVAAAGIVGLVAMGGSRAVRSAVAWLHTQPANRIPVEKVTLVPPPDPWIRSGSATFLRAIRAEAKDDQVPLLDLDLDGLSKALRHCPWVKDVGRIERKYGSLTVHLSYYQPVAVAPIGEDRALVIDRDGVILPGEDIAWEPSDPPFRRLRGRDDPLIQLDGFEPPADPNPRPGSLWGRDDAANPMVVRAARLAEFLDASARADGPGAIRFDLILPDKPLKGSEPPLGLFARTPKGLYVFWGWSPEPEAPGKPTASEKWAMLRDWTAQYGPPRVAFPNFVSFLASGLVDRTRAPLVPPPTRDRPPPPGRR